MDAKPTNKILAQVKNMKNSYISSFFKKPSTIWSQIRKCL